LFSKASAPPQTIKASLDAPRTTDYGHEVVHTVSDLRKLEWARNPYIVSPRDWTHALGLGVVVLEAILYPEDLGFMDNLREETFWKNLLPLIQGKVFSPKGQGQGDHGGADRQCDRDVKASAALACKASKSA
jgi:hypothetical protein